MADGYLVARAEVRCKHPRWVNAARPYERYEVIPIPSLERLLALLRACGLELRLRLANVDVTDHDRVVIKRALRRAPAERLRRGFAAGRAFGSPRCAT